MRALLWRGSMAVSKAIAGGALLVLVSGLVAPAHIRAQRLAVPDNIRADTKAELNARMSRHGATMSSLVRAVVLLERARVRVLAGRIADEEVVAQIDTPKPMSLPPGFSAEQAQLSVAARRLAVAAAEGSDDRVLAERFAAVTAACVTCHSVYLQGPHSRPLRWEGR